MTTPTGMLPPGLSQPSSFIPSSSTTFGNTPSAAFGVSPVKPVSQLSPGISGLGNPVSPLNSGSPGLINPASPALSLGLSPGMANPVSPLSGYGGSVNPPYSRGPPIGLPGFPPPAPPPPPLPRYLQHCPPPVPPVQPVQPVMFQPPMQHQYVHHMPATQFVQGPPPPVPMISQQPTIVQSVPVLPTHYVQHPHPQAQYVMALGPPVPPPPPPLPPYVHMHPPMGPTTYTMFR